jgi:ribosomal protein S27E
MSEHYGVKCHECEKTTRLADADHNSPNQMAFFTVPSEEIECLNCGHKGLYGPKEGFGYWMEDPTPFGL